MTGLPLYDGTGYSLIALRGIIKAKYILYNGQHWLIGLEGMTGTSRVPYSPYIAPNSYVLILESDDGHWYYQMVSEDSWTIVNVGDYFPIWQQACVVDVR